MERGSRRAGRPRGGPDVREAILSAALRLLSATGTPEQVTVSAVVAEAGCTPPSLYHYWPSREHLLREASRVGWRRFRSSQAAAVEQTTDPLDRLAQRGRAYLEFALAEPALFRVLFLSPGSMDATAPPDPEGNALDDLVSDVAQAMSRGSLRPGDPFTTALALWAAVHGVAALWAVTPDLPPDMARSTADTARSALLAGLAPSARRPCLHADQA